MVRRQTAQKMFVTFILVTLPLADLGLTLSEKLNCILLVLQLDFNLRGGFFALILKHANVIDRFSHLRCWNELNTSLECVVIRLPV